MKIRDITDSTDGSIYLDLDDVLCDTAVAYLDLIDREFGLKIEFEKIFSFDLQKSFGLSDEANQHMFRCAHQPDFIININVFPGVSETLERWKALGHRLHIVTGRHTSSYQPTLDWLEQNDIHYDSFTMVDKYGWEDTDHDLAVPLAAIRSRDYFLAIEDNMEMTKFLTSSMDLPVMLYDRPWNRTLSPDPRVERFQDWNELNSDYPGGG